MEALKHYGVFGAGLSNFSTVYPSMQVTRLASWDLIGPHTIFIWKCQWKPESSACFCWSRRSGCSCGSGKKNKRPAGKPNPWMVAVEAASWSILTAAMFAHLFWEKSFWFLWIMVAFATQLFRNNYQSTERVQPKSTLGVRRQNPAFF